LAYEREGDELPVVIHTAAPRFRMAMSRQGDRWISTEVRWLDKPPLDAELLARLMREAGEAFAAAGE
ncbi:MAG TPA: hypothetical protein VMW52_11755, partial [Phycisphaerae bacterium]|nr:hypothetical protein [Phycisphaerae bacterium]